MGQVKSTERKRKMKNKYGDFNELAVLGFMANALEKKGDRGASFPRSDAEDLSRGLRFIPGEVTVARRRGECVSFTQYCQCKNCWYWQFEDGSRTYYWERWIYESTALQNGIELETTEYGSKTGNPGACPSCGNTHMMGGHIKVEDL